jgi:hypothetical protein
MAEADDAMARRVKELDQKTAEANRLKALKDKTYKASDEFVKAEESAKIAGTN